MSETSFKGTIAKGIKIKLADYEMCDLHYSFEFEGLSDLTFKQELINGILFKEIKLTFANKGVNLTNKQIAQRYGLTEPKEIHPESDSDSDFLN